MILYQKAQTGLKFLTRGAKKLKKYVDEGVETVYRQSSHKSKKNLSSFPTVNPTAAERNMAKKAKQEAQGWLNDEEWMRRRQVATGESRAKSEAIRAAAKDKLKRTTVTVKDVGSEMPREWGSVVSGNWFGQNPELFFARSTNPHAPAVSGTFFHEFGHAERAWLGKEGREGINFVNVKDSPRMTDYQKMNAMDLRRVEEQRIRAVATLKHLREKGLWSGRGPVNDNAMDYLLFNSRMPRRLPEDVAELVRYLPNKKYLQPLLNTAYTGFGAGALGTGLKAAKE